MVRCEERREEERGDKPGAHSRLIIAQVPKGRESKHSATPNERAIEGYHLRAGCGAVASSCWQLLAYLERMCVCGGCMRREFICGGEQVCSRRSKTWSSSPRPSRAWTPPTRRPSTRRCPTRPQHPRAHALAGSCAILVRRLLQRACAGRYCWLEAVLSDGGGSGGADERG